MSNFLALFRAGPNSLHGNAIERLNQQNFDYALSWFGEQPPENASGALFVDYQKGSKWVGLEQTLRRHWGLIQEYDYVWLPDDDLLCNPEDVSRMFLVCQDLRLELAQPSLTLDSYFSHVITLQHREYQVRFTNFVEIMAPVLSKAMLLKIMPTLAGAISGYGLDAVWPRMSELGRVAIIDDVAIKHTRPVGGPNYKFNKEVGITPTQEAWVKTASHFIDVSWDYHINYGGLLQNGDTVSVGQDEVSFNCFLYTILKSCSGMPISALQLTRYLRHHFNYWAHADSGYPSYPRGMVALILNQAHKSVGLNFI